MQTVTRMGAGATARTAPPELIPGWRTLWSPLTGRIRHVVELIRERELNLAEIAEIEARALAVALPEPASAWALELFDHLALGADALERLRFDDRAEAEALCELLYGLRGPMRLDVERAPWGADWKIEELAVRVFIAVPSEQAPYYEIAPL